MAPTSLSAQAASRKCWPSRFFARGRGSGILDRLAAPVLLLDLLDLLFAQPEVVADLVNQGRPDLRAQLAATVRAAVDNLINNNESFRRDFLDGRRPSPILFTEYRDRFFGPIFTLSISGTI